MEQRMTQLQKTLGFSRQANLSTDRKDQGSDETARQVRR